MGLLDAFRPSQSADTAVYSAVVDAAPSWDALRELSASAGGAKLREKWEAEAAGRGAASHQANLRLFDAPDGTEPTVELFRDTAGWCPYCQKVWALLEAKRIPYRVTKVPMSSYGVKPPAFRAISPSGAIPIARIDGRIVPESNDIMFELDARFPQRPMMPPAGTPAAARARELMDLERALFSAWFGWLRSRQDGLPKFEFHLDRACAALAESGGPFFLGAEFSMVDCMFLPFVERMVASLPYYKGVRVRGEPRWAALDRWLLALETRTEWYAGMKSDYYTHAHDLPPQIGGCVSAGAEAERIAAQIDGTDGRSWALPLPAATLASLEPVSPPIADADARLEAAERLLRNRDNVARFAARAVGAPGAPGVSAPLSDPNAKPELLAVPAVDAALRHVVHALLVGPAEARAAGRSTLPAREVAMSLAYLRDRVGVPRDMTFAAARQLRAHLNDFSAELTGGKVLY